MVFGALFWEFTVAASINKDEFTAKIRNSYIFSGIVNDSAVHMILTELLQRGLGEKKSLPRLRHNVEEVFRVWIRVWPRRLWGTQCRPRCTSQQGTWCLLLTIKHHVRNNTINNDREWNNSQEHENINQVKLIRDLPCVSSYNKGQTPVHTMT